MRSLRSLSTFARAAVPLGRGGVLLLVAFAVALGGCKPKPKGAKIAPRVEQAPEKALSVSTEPWVDVLKSPEKLALQNGAEFRGGALRLASRSSAKVRDSAGQNDGALRLVAQLEPSQAGPAIAARIQDSGSRYVLAVKSETAARLSQVLGSGEEIVLKDFVLARPLQAAKPYELELRVAGSTLTSKLNGTVLGEVTEGSLPDGMMSVSLDLASPVLIAALQYLPLGSSAPVSTGATEQWIDVLENSDFLSRNTGFKKEAEGLNVSGWANLLPKPARNCAVRLTLDNALQTTPLRVSLRQGEEGHYSLYIRPSRGIFVHRYKAADKSDVVLIEKPIPANLPQDQDVVIEFRAVGPRVSVKVNGEELQFAEDTTIKEGQAGLGASKQAIEEYGEVKVKKLEYAVLDQG
jgi:hypothetical protein